jgi:hypothetical protein
LRNLKPFQSSKKKLADNKISTPPIVGKKALEKPSAISKLQEKKLAENKSSTPPTVGKKPLRNHLQPSQSCNKENY